VQGRYQVDSSEGVREGGLGVGVIPIRLFNDDEIGDIGDRTRQREHEVEVATGSNSASRSARHSRRARPCGSARWRRHRCRREFCIGVQFDEPGLVGIQTPRRQADHVSWVCRSAYPAGQHYQLLSECSVHSAVLSADALDRFSFGRNAGLLPPFPGPRNVSCFEMFDPSMLFPDWPGAHPGVQCQFYLALISWMLGYPDRYRDELRAAVRSAETLGHPVTLAQTLCYAALVHTFRHEPPAAADYPPTEAILPHRARPGRKHRRRAPTDPPAKSAPTKR
jgi:hypothetical protein